MDGKENKALTDRPTAAQNIMNANCHARRRGLMILAEKPTATYNRENGNKTPSNALSFH